MAGVRRPVVPAPSPVIATARRPGTTTGRGIGRAQRRLGAFRRTLAGLFLRDRRDRDVCRHHHDPVRNPVLQAGRLRALAVRASGGKAAGPQPFPQRGRQCSVVLLRRHRAGVGSPADWHRPVSHRHRDPVRPREARSAPSRQAPPRANSRPGRPPRLPPPEDEVRNAAGAGHGLEVEPVKQVIV